MESRAGKELLLPLFPLPNLVFFPKARLPLHIFEPRYRQMVEDALEGEKQIGMVLLRPGWESDDQGNPAVHSVGTLGTIEQSVQLDDGRWNILLQGEVRFRIVEELPHAPYRLARVRVQPEVPGDPTAAWTEREWLAELSRRYLEYLPGQMDVPEIDTVGLDALSNALIMSLNIDPEGKQSLLELDDPIVRAHRVGIELQERIESLTFLAPFRKEGDPSRN